MIAEIAPQMARPCAKFIGNTRSHQQAADVCKAQAQSTVTIAQFRNATRRELGHRDRDFEHDRPQPAGVLEHFCIEVAIRIPEGHQVERRQIARRVVQEHVFRARIRGADLTAVRACVPVVDRRMELDTGIG